MSATTIGFKKEFKSFYNTDTIEVPCNKECIRKEQNDIIYRTQTEKLIQVITLITERHAAGQPVLVDCPDIKTAEFIYKILNLKNINDRTKEVLSAINHFDESDNKFSKIYKSLSFKDIDHTKLRILTAINAEEAGIIAKAGEYGSVTISAKMAGRGTDIVISKKSKDVGHYL
ncbi:MAG: hypothetical protein OMM_03365 [Candidatus Magnetoglobus multicellularis str. Araruama]|uniref:SecA family profile domain-containing protein n=1 Tax=Candidatus Magnetoglobus multicellularis str. Araruama TaxID=890399 RepID=A0A1V1P5V6_9BACT|nr:MAG: hypothetical protein OMM_03365 [Candidatus Magnetoglobus multicellularis str. Araruama]